MNFLPCALLYFWEYANIAWENCEANLDSFAAKSPRFTKEYVAERLAYIQQVKSLPNNTVRSSISGKVRLALLANRQLVIGQLNLLDNAIGYTYREQPALVAIERKQAGIDALRVATDSDWAAVSSFIGTASSYLSQSGDKLVASGSISAEFAANFEAVGAGFNAVWKELVSKRQSAREGTQSVAEGIKQILLDLNLMLDLGKQLFEYEPSLRKLFTTEYLVAEVRGGHMAGIQGRVLLEGAEQPVQGALVEVLGMNKSVITDKKGRYSFKLSGGEYSLRVSAPGVLPSEQLVTVEAGVMRRQNVLLLPSTAETGGTAASGALDAARTSFKSSRPIFQNGVTTAPEAEG